MGCILSACVHVLQLNYAVCGKVELFYNVNVDWGLISDDYSYDDVDYSDDDIVDRSQVRTTTRTMTSTTPMTTSSIGRR